MTGNPGFQVSLDVMGRLCLVIGGDDEAAEKISRLLEAGANVVVVNPTNGKFFPPVLLFHPTTISFSTFPVANLWYPLLKRESAIYRKRIVYG